MAAFAGELPDALVVAVEYGAEGGQLANPSGPFTDEYLHRRRIAQSGPSPQGVGRVQGYGIDRAPTLRIPGLRYVRLAVMQDRGDTALRPLGGGVGEGALRQDADAQSRVLLGTPGRGRQAGHPAADHQKVEGRHRLARTSGDPRISCRAVVASVARAQGDPVTAGVGTVTARFHWSTCTTTGA